MEVLHLKKILLIVLLMFAFITQLPIEQKVLATTDNFDKYYVEPKLDLDSPSYLPLNEVDTFANIVIFVRFNDEGGYQAPYSYSYYNIMYNGVDQVSLRDYYLEVSYNQLTIDSYLSTDGSQIIFYTDDHNRSYYEPYDAIYNTNGYKEDSTDSTELQTYREHTLFKNAVDFVDSSGLIDPSIVLDSNNDGDIDSLSFLVSKEDNGWNTLLWPHQWALYTYDNTSDAPMINGAYAYEYTMQLLGDNRNYNNKVDVFVLAHEMFHVLGATDLYHYYDYDYIDNVGKWGLMDYNATIPAHMLGYMKEYYGHWIDQVDEITETGTYTLYPLADSADNLYRINTGYSNEFIYLEYREIDSLDLYESQLPDSGLLAYRVDFDHAGEGNVEGYYGIDDESSNEVFVFRPGITDMVPPIEFPENPSSDDFDGNLNDAAMSNNNLYDSAGGNSQILLFHSDGSLIDVRIQDVTEYDGYITFEVTLTISINLIMDGQIDPSSDVHLWNDASMDYQIEVLNLGSLQAYYTLDGSSPTPDDHLYVEPVHIDALNHLVTVSIYDGESLIETISKNYDFVDSIESQHYDYGDMKNITWIISPGQFIESFNVLFSEDSEFEADFDYVYITYQGNTNIYTSLDLANELYESIDSTMMIQLVSDQLVSDYYGFSVDIAYDQQIPITLNGESTLTLAIGQTYEELGAILLEDYQSLYTLQIDGSIDTSVLGEQYVYYYLMDQANHIVYTVIRIVTLVADSELPTFDQIANQTIEIGQTDIDWSTLIENAQDNVSSILIFAEQSDFVIYDELGTYTVIVSVTDSSGNVQTDDFEVTVSDTMKPIVSLNPSLDSIYVGDTYEDFGVTIIDSTQTILNVEGEIDETTPGVYQLTYTVVDEALNQTQIIRYVHVTQAKTSVVFTLGETKTTIAVGETYVDGDCTVQIGEESFTCDIKQNNVNVNTPSVQIIIYSYTFNEQEYTFKRYVFVYGTSPLVLEYRKEEEGIYA